MKGGDLGKKVLGGLLAACVGVLAALVLTCALDVIKMKGDTMEPAIAGDSHVIVYKWAYAFGKPQKGDLVAFPSCVYSEDGEGSTLVKRVVATEGDFVEIKEGCLYINGALFDEYAAEPVYMEPMKGTVIQKSKVFVLSDKRSAVLDSRDEAIGQLAARELTGKVWFKPWAKENR